MPDSAVGGAAGPVLDADTWQAQLDELVALASILDQDFRLLSAGGIQVPAAADGAAADAGGEGDADAADVPPEELYAYGPPSQPGVFSCEVTVHVDTQGHPEGLQLLISTAGAGGAQAAQGDGMSGQSPSNASVASRSGKHGAQPAVASTTAATAAAAAAAAAPSALRRLSASALPFQPSSSISAAAAAPPPELTPFGAVRHLPPICMHLTFPAAYPNTAPPLVELRAMWLRPAQVAQLQASLLAEWTQAGGAGTPICYTWVEWLRANTLQELGIAQTGRVVLGAMPGAAEHAASCSHSKASYTSSTAAAAPAGAAATAASIYSNGNGTAAAVAAPGVEGQQKGQQQAAGTLASSSSSDRQPSHLQPPEELEVDVQRVGLDDVPAEEVALSMLRYSAQHEHYLFQSQPVQCPVCFDDVLGRSCMRLDCGHFSCRTCFTTYVRTQVQEGAVQQIRCLDPSCLAPVHASIVKAVLSPEEYQRFEELLLNRTLEKMQDVAYCPRCHTVSVEDPDHCAQCPKCFYVFCGLCDEAWHPGSQCLTPDQAIERKRERLERSGNMSAEERQRRQADLLGQYKSVSLVFATSKQCPACGMAIQKTEGCNKMQCGFCNTKFCFRCLRVIEDYNHFGVGRCDLFDAEEINRWNAAQQAAPINRFHHIAAAGFIVREARRRPGTVRFAACPSCGQHNIKESRNNLIRCYACNRYFCYTCRELLRFKPGLHFGPSSSQCRQHTDD